MIFLLIISQFKRKIKMSRESFFTKQEPRFYKEEFKTNKNISQTASSFNPIGNQSHTPSWSSTPKSGYLKKDMKTTNTIFGETRTQEKPLWMGNSHKRVASSTLFQTSDEALYKKKDMTENKKITHTKTKELIGSNPIGNHGASTN